MTSGVSWSQTRTSDHGGSVYLIHCTTMIIGVPEAHRIPPVIHYFLLLNPSDPGVVVVREHGYR